ncbi:hypothetical protein VTH06DRAFT_4734 [Thermothelomyces fergusii]
MYFKVKYHAPMANAAVHSASKKPPGWWDIRRPSFRQDVNGLSFRGTGGKEDFICDAIPGVFRVDLGNEVSKDSLQFFE